MKMKGSYTLFGQSDDLQSERKCEINVFSAHNIGYNIKAEYGFQIIKFIKPCVLENCMNNLMLLVTKIVEMLGRWIDFSETSVLQICIIMRIKKRSTHHLNQGFLV